MHHPPKTRPKQAPDKPSFSLMWSLVGGGGDVWLGVVCLKNRYQFGNPLPHTIVKPTSFPTLYRIKTLNPLYTKPIL